MIQDASSPLGSFRARPESDGNNAGVRSLQRQLDILQGELQREQNLRSTDRQRHDQVASRLRQQMQFSVDESDHFKSMLEEQQDQSNDEVERLKSQLTKTINILTEVEQENQDFLRERGEHSGKGHQISMLLESKTMMEKNLTASRSENDQLRQALQLSENRALLAEQASNECNVGANVVSTEDDTERTEKSDEFDDPVDPEMKARVQSVINKRQHKNRVPTTADELLDDAYGISPSKKRTKRASGDLLRSPRSSAPEAVLKELNNLRSSLQECERENRILQRAFESEQAKCKDLGHVERELKRCQEKLSAKEAHFKQMLNEVAVTEELKNQWKVWHQEIEELFSFSASSLGPPETSSLTRQMKSLKEQRDEAITERESITMELKSCKRHLARYETELNEGQKIILKLQTEHSDHSKAIHILQMTADQANEAERIAKSEAESMRQLIDTFESQERQSTSMSPGVKGSPSLEGLRTSLDAAHEEIECLKKSADVARKELQTLQKQTAEESVKYEAVLVKFGKLREALMAEREKATTAETRAIRAETLAGKGFFNSDITRALHLKKNPLVDALMERHEKGVATLKATIERQRLQLERNPAAAALVQQRPEGKCSCGFDEKKLNKRLKESFKEQIGCFREGVYLMTGYKIDMTIVADCPQFKVRSVFAELESDHLAFKWPSLESGKGRAVAPSALDLMSTGFAESCTKLDVFDYLAKFKSVPAFMSALTLKLFENSTFTG